MSEGRPTASPAELAKLRDTLAARGPAEPDRHTGPSHTGLLAPLHTCARMRSQPTASDHGPGYLDDLAALADDEVWDAEAQRYEGERRVLKAYLGFTFQRLIDQDRIATSHDGKWAAANTGLVTSQHTEICGLFSLNRNPGRQRWAHSRWCTESDRLFMDLFDGPPPRASYTDDPGDLRYDTARTLTVAYEHIVEDNLDRFPAEVHGSPYRAGLILRGAVALAEKRVRQDFRTAVPSWYPRGSQVQLLLPLCFTDPAVTDLALVVGRQGEHYRGHTVLTPGMAYPNARLLSRLGSDWLTPAADDDPDED